LGARARLAGRLLIVAGGEYGVRGPVPLEDPVRHEPLLRTLRAHLLGCLAERERFRLREDIRHQQVVMVADRIEGMAEPDEVGRNELRALVDELVERVLAVRSGLSPKNRAGLVVDVRALQG